MALELGWTMNRARGIAQDRKACAAEAGIRHTSLVANGEQERTPRDSMGYYLTPQGGVGQRLNLETIDERLAALPLIRTLQILSQIVFVTDKAALVPDEQMGLARRILPDPVAERAIARLEREPMAALTSTQVVLNLVVRALANCGDDHLCADRDDDWLAKRLGVLIMALGDFTSRDAQGGTDRDTLTLELVRVTLFSSVHALHGWYRVTDELLFDVLPTLSAHPGFVDIDALLLGDIGLTLRRLWALTVGYGLLSYTDPDGFRLPRVIEGGSVSQADVERWMKVWAAPLEESRDVAKVAAEQPGSWSFGTLYSRPVIELGPMSGIAVRPFFLAAKATVSGMFWAIQEPYVRTGRAHERLAELFGAAVESLGRTILARNPGPYEWVSETDISPRWGAGHCCDAVGLGAGWLAIDFVFHQLTRATTTTGAFDALASDIQKTVIKKLGQVDDTLRRALDSEAQPQRIVPVVVVGAPFPANPLLASYIAAELAQQELHVIGVDDRCSPPAVLDLSEFNTAIEVAAASGRPLHELLDGWLTSPMGGMSMREWLVTDGPGRAVPDEDIEDVPYMRRLRAELFGAPTQT